MSKHLLNTIILILVLIIITGGGLYFVHTQYGQKTADLKVKLEEKKQKYDELVSFQKEVEEKKKQLEDLQYQLDNFPTMLINKDYIQQAYLYFEKFDPNGEFFNFNYKINGTNKKNDVTEARYNLRGVGDFAKTNDFINYLEYSPPLFFIDDFTFSSKGEKGSINLTIRGIFIDKATDEGRDLFNINPQRRYGDSYDPFQPLILWELPPNYDDLVDIRDAKLVSLLESNSAWFKLPGGELVQLEVGDRVYLGRLSSIDLEEGTATFNMNLGGIKETEIKTLNRKVTNAE